MDYTTARYLLLALLILAGIAKFVNWILDKGDQDLSDQSDLDSDLSSRYDADGNRRL